MRDVLELCGAIVLVALSIFLGLGLGLLLLVYLMKLVGL